MVHEMTLSDGSLGVACLKFRSVCKRVLKLLNPKGRRSPTRGVLVKRCSNGSTKQRVSWTASFAYRQQQKQKLKKKSRWSLGGYKKLKNSGEGSDQQKTVQNSGSRESSESRSSFSFGIAAEEAGPVERTEVLFQRVVELEQAGSLMVPPGLKPRWDEVVEMVIAGSFDDLVDLEEFFGYYVLLRCPIFRELVQRFFSEFCCEFDEDEEIQGVNLFIPEMQEFPSFGESSERELECLPPTPCSRV